MYLLPKITTKDSILREQYNKMLREKEIYEFLCYCPRAEIMGKKVAFVAYTLKEGIRL